MCYPLILSFTERAAFDWVGNRYANGDPMRRLIESCLPDDVEWADRTLIEFKIPEYKAWEIKEHAEREDNLWPCFAPELAAKMQAFVDGIV